MRKNNILGVAKTAFNDFGFVEYEIGFENGNIVIVYRSTPLFRKAFKELMDSPRAFYEFKKHRPIGEVQRLKRLMNCDYVVDSFWHCFIDKTGSETDVSYDVYIPGNYYGYRYNKSRMIYGSFKDVVDIINDFIENDNHILHSKYFRKENDILGVVPSPEFLPTTNIEGYNDMLEREGYHYRY